MKYRIGYVSKATGFSASGIRFYEDEGIIEPDRVDTSGYREFGYEELSTLLACKNLRRCGFSLTDTVKLINESDMNIVCNYYDKQIDKLHDEVNKKKVLIDYLEKQEREVGQIPNYAGPLEIKSPAIYWFEIVEANSGDEVLNHETARWFEVAPFADSCLIFRKNEFLSKKEFIKPVIGTSIDKVYADKLGFLPGAKAATVDSVRCVWALAEVTDSLEIRTCDIEPVKQFIHEKRFTVSADIISRRLISTRRNNKKYRLDNLWIPVQQIKSE